MDNLWHQNSKQSVLVMSGASLILHLRCEMSPSSTRCLQLGRLDTTVARWCLKVALLFSNHFQLLSTAFLMCVGTELTMCRQGYLIHLIFRQFQCHMGPKAVRTCNSFFFCMVVSHTLNPNLYFSRHVSLFLKCNQVHGRWHLCALCGGCGGLC